MTAPDLDIWSVVVDRELAEKIRAWRNNGEHTWREIASIVSGHLGLEPCNHQMAGYELCEKAAKVLGENPHAEPWN